LLTDFRKKDWNRIYRHEAPIKKLRAASAKGEKRPKPVLVEALATLSGQGA
jgi:hypothetical protein